MQNQSTLKFLGDNYPLLLIILLGAVLRIYDLSGESIWLDEAYTINISKYDPVGIIKEILRDNENHPPLYYSFMYYWIKVFGDSSISVRLPSVIFGVLSIIAIYKMAILLFNKNAALFSALILATSVYLIGLSQEARSYSLLGLLTLISFYYFTKLVGQKSNWVSVLYVVTTLLLLYTHYYSVFILIAQNIFFLTIYLLSRKDTVLNLRKWILLQLVLFVLNLPQVYLILQASAVKGGLWLNAPGIEAVPGTVLAYSSSWLLFLMFLVLSAAAVFNLKSAFQMKNLRDYYQLLFYRSGGSGLTHIQTVYLLIIWLSVPLVLPFLISVFITPIYQARYKIGCAAAFYILVAKGIDSLGNKRVIVIIVGIILLLSLSSSRDYYAAVNKHQWREAVTYLESEAGPSRLIMVSPGYELKTGLYHSSRDDLEMIEFSQDSLSELDKDSYDFWVILSWHGATGKETRTLELLKHYNVESFENFYKLKIYHYKQ